MEKNIYINGEYIRINPNYHAEDSPWKAQQIFNMFSKHNLHPKSVCEIGCGAGGILQQIQLYMSPETVFYGYEISPQAFELCYKWQNERLTFFCEDLLSKNTDFFDVLLCIDVFEHIEDYWGFLKKLKPKASYLIFHIPLEISVLTVSLNSSLLHSRRTGGHLHYFTKEIALATLQDNGYEILDHIYTPSGVDLSRTLKAKTLELPRKILFGIAPDLAVRTLGGYSLLVLTK